MMTAVGVAGLLAGAADAQTVISNAPNGQTINFFGKPAAANQTFGQVFTAPITGTLTSFTLSLTGGVGELFGEVGTWNGGPTFATGFWSPTNLYQSANIASTGPQAFTFTPNVAVVAGQQYVAYLTTFGANLNANASTTMVGGDALPDSYFVWKNAGDPHDGTQWGYTNRSLTFGNALFSASFSGAGAVPEPTTWALMIIGFGAMSAALRRQRHVSAKIRFA